MEQETEKIQEMEMEQETEKIQETEMEQETEKIQETEMEQEAEQIQEMEMTPEMAGIRKITKMKGQIAVPGKIPAREEIPVHREMQVRTIWTRKMGKSWKIAWRRISSCWKTISSH